MLHQISIEYRDRYAAITYPLWHRKHVTVNRVILVQVSHANRCPNLMLVTELKFNCVGGGLYDSLFESVGAIHL